MMTSCAPLPALLNPSGKILRSLAIVLAGIAFLSVLAQVAIPLPWTVIPITGQTFGITLLALLYGRKLGTMSVLGHIGLGAAGAPVLAMGTSLFPIGPSAGYLVGMFAATLLMGALSDRGATRSFFRSWLTGLLGSVLVFGFGLAWLSLFIPSEHLLASGLLPFLPGDLVKTAVAAGIASQSSRLTRRQER